MTALRPGQRVHFVGSDRKGHPGDRGTVWADNPPQLVVVWDCDHDDAPYIDLIDADGWLLGLPGCRVVPAPTPPLTGEPL